MAHAFARIMFTPAVKDVQTKMGSRGANERFDEPDAPAADQLGPFEREFLAARDSFYMATVSETGWPYVQHRGGPPGFLKVIDARTIGFADFRGNRQYVSVGNLTRDNRVSLILVDYPNRRRLKIIGRSRLADLRSDPEVIERLRDDDYDARVERAIVIDIEGFDWNCPQHITPRFTEAEVAEAVAPLRSRLAAAEARVRQEDGDRLLVVGTGPLEVEIVGVAALADGVRGYRLRSADRAPLPAWSAGAHISVPVVLPDGTVTTRQYSLAGDPAQRSTYEFAVLDVDRGRGGSRYVHRHYELGTRLRIGAPRSHFSLDPAHTTVTLVAGGIGITPIRSMALALSRSGFRVALHYVGRSRERIAYLDELFATDRIDLTLHLTTGEGHNGRPDVSALVPNYAEGNGLYVCGPPGLIASVRDAAAIKGWPASAVRSERFLAATPAASGHPFDLVLARSGRRLAVAADQSALEALESAGLPVPSSCRSGICSTCVVNVTGGEPDHRDSVLSEAERAAGRFCTCVSRAHGAELIVDL
jgi:ferredoxin-NADP reductase/predicted pyridoxine 5'-phosphate oxidase superfamily flavin-nucleotide-binding protein